MSVLATCSLQKGIQGTVLLLFTFPPIQPQASFYSYCWPQREEFFTSMLILFSPNISIHLVAEEDFFWGSFSVAVLLLGTLSGLSLCLLSIAQMIQPSISPLSKYFEHFLNLKLNIRIPSKKAFKSW